MDATSFFLLSTLQGLTEFLPISSSGHLFVAQHFLGFEPNIVYEIWLHGATLLAVLLYYRRDVWQLLGALGGSLVGASTSSDDQRYALQLLLATGVTFALALPIHNAFGEGATLGFVVGTFVCMGAMMMSAEYFRPQKERPLTWYVAVILGIVQAIAVLPGISRSGICLAFLIALGVGRTKAMQATFLLAIPTIAASLIYGIRESGGEGVLEPWFVGGLSVCFVIAYATIGLMNRLVQKWWVAFGPYCIAVGAGLWIWMMYR